MMYENEVRLFLSPAKENEVWRHVGRHKYRTWSTDWIEWPGDQLVRVFWTRQPEKSQQHVHMQQKSVRAKRLDHDNLTSHPAYFLFILLNSVIIFLFSVNQSYDFSTAFNNQNIRP